MDSRAERLATTRLFVLAGLALLWAIVILLRLVQVQVVRHQEYLREARVRHLKKVGLPARRGMILDRAGRPLAMMRKLESVYVDPRHVPDCEVAAGLLGGVLGLDRAALYERLEQARRRRRGFMWVKRRISPEEAGRLRSLKKNWIRFEAELVREYPKGPLAAPIIGAVSFEQRGSAGLEHSLEEELRGRQGWARVLADVWNREVESEAVAEAEPGVNIGLTIDERIQFVAERELQAAAEACRCPSGSVVVMDPHTGEVLAAASFPGFDPRQPPRNKEEERLRDLNHVVSVPFEPGSVFKVVTIAAALETTRLRPETVIPCGNGRITLFGRVVRDHHPYSALTLTEVLAKSSNIGTINIGLKVGESRMFDYVRRFGFGQKTGVPLPAESAGKVRALAAWQRTSLASIAMGHELSATSLQLARAMSVIANGGLLVRPKLIGWRQRAGGPLREEANEAPVRVLAPETAILMRRLTEEVVLRGTGRAARLNGYSAGGKTGTAQIYDPVKRKYTQSYNSSFVGFAPVTSPAIVVAVTLNGARQYGGAVAAPVFRKIAGEALRLMNVPEDLPAGLAPPEAESVDMNDLAVAELSTPPAEPAAETAWPPDQPAAGAQAALLVAGPPAPDFQGKPLRVVLREALAAGITVETVGSGLARAQFPGPARPLAPGSPVRVVFAP